MAQRHGNFTTDQAGDSCCRAHRKRFVLVLNVAGNRPLANFDSAATRIAVRRSRPVCSITSSVQDVLAGPAPAWGCGSAGSLRRHASAQSDSCNTYRPLTAHGTMCAKGKTILWIALQVRQNYGVTIDRAFKPTSNARLAATFGETKRFADALRKFDKQCSAHLQGVKGVASSPPLTLPELASSVAVWMQQTDACLTLRVS